MVNAAKTNIGYTRDNVLATVVIGQNIAAYARRVLCNRACIINSHRTVIQNIYLNKAAVGIPVTGICCYAKAERNRIVRICRIRMIQNTDQRKGVSTGRLVENQRKDSFSANFTDIIITHNHNRHRLAL